METKTLRDFRKECKNIYCYGIGVWGNLTRKYCKKHNIKIDGYIVSKLSDDNVWFYGNKVHEIGDLEINSMDGIIFATSEKKFKQEMENEVRKKTKANKFFFVDSNNCFFRYFSRMYRKTVKKRKKRNLFDFLQLARPITFVRFGDWNEDNIYYGQDRCIRKYVKKTFYDIKKTTIDHGVRIACLHTEKEMNPQDHHIYAMSDFVWRNIPNVNVHSIGPYINYRKAMLTNKQLKQLKIKFGKTLLVFPVHSLNRLNISYDYDTFINEIENIKSTYNYKSVIVCMFCSDILKKEYSVFKRKGYKIVTAGYTMDYNFLNRLKTFLILSDHVITNGFGSHIGYSISLNKPVYYFKMDIYEERDSERKIISELGYKAYNNESLDNEVQRGSERMNQIMSYFTSYRENIDNEQYDVIAKYWGERNKGCCISKKGVVIK